MEGSRFQTLIAAEFTDVDQLCENARHWDLSFRPLAAPAGSGALARMLQGRARRIDYSYARFLVGLDQRGAPPAGKYTFTIPGSSLGQLWWRGQTTGAQDILVFSPSSELASFSGPDFEVHLISVTPEDLAAYAERRGLEVPAKARLPSVFKLPVAHLRRARGVLAGLGAGPSPFAFCDLDILAEDLVCSWLSQAGLRPRRTDPSASGRVVDAFLERVSEGDVRDLRISDLCVAGNISRRALELTFRERFGVSPSAFLKRMRLCQAYRDLTVASSIDRTVGDVMDKVGLTHVGRFAQEYRSLFGELPSHTLAQ
ncbi:hypothetical protein CHH27_23290 [Labrenzia sp. VG12]|nr:hypothetical protein CHH27_23290 [Labrenzia sp. VG12]